MLSTSDLSSPSNLDWLDKGQQAAHILNAGVTPDACYANLSLPGVPNAVAWTRSPEYMGTPGPDDIYIGTAISGNYMKTLYNGGSEGACTSTGYGCMVRFQVQMPDTPETPCSGCTLIGSEDLRYMSLTFWYPTSCSDSGDQALIADPDGTINGSAGCVGTMISLADVAFAKNFSNGKSYATLLVNVAAQAPNPLNTTWLQQTALSQGVTSGSSRCSRRQPAARRSPTIRSGQCLEAAVAIPFWI